MINQYKINENEIILIIQLNLKNLDLMKYTINLNLIIKNKKYTKLIISYYLFFQNNNQITIIVKNLITVKIQLIKTSFLHFFYFKKIYYF